MIEDARSLPDGTTLKTDIAVIGAGAAGITLTRTLAEAGLTVCLLEGGGLDFDPESQDLYRGSHRGRPYHDLDAARLRFFGGTTNHWTGWCRPLEPIDFERRPWLPGSGWPIRWQDLAAFYEPAAKLCELERTGFGADEFGDAVPPFFRRATESGQAVVKVWQRSTPTRFGEVYRAEIADAPGVRCLLHANVVAFDLDENRAVVAAAARTLTDRVIRVEARVFVLACGGIENARLLLQPNPRFPAGVGNSSDQVGRYFMLHPILDVGSMIAAGSAVTLFKVPGRDGRSDLRVGLALPDETQRALDLPHHALLLDESSPHQAVTTRGLKAFRRRISNPFGTRYPLADDVRAILGDLDGIAYFAYEEFGERVSRWIGRRMRRAFFNLVLRMEHGPNPDSRVLLGDERDRLGLLRAVVDWRMADFEKPAVRRTVERLAEVAGTTGAVRVQIADWVRDDTLPWPDWVDGDYHHLGTTRMSETPRAGVVNADCRVHDVPNLYVAGSSVFPAGGFANPTLTIVALALRLSDRLQRELANVVTVGRPQSRS